MQGIVLICCVSQYPVFLPQAFGQFDAEGDGVVDIESMLIALKNSNGANLKGELSHVIRQLQACTLTPGMRYQTFAVVMLNNMEVKTKLRGFSQG